jgi:hypothetical protein
VSEEGAPTIELFSSEDSCAGSAAAFVCRAIALHAGAYAPGIHEFIFTPLIDRRFGRDVDAVFRWFLAHSTDLFRLGYKLRARRIAFQTPAITEWISNGDGYRGAVLGTDGAMFHQPFDSRVNHAVGITVGGPGVPAPNGEKSETANGLLVSDPWPGVDHHRHADGTLEAAHRGRKYASLIIFWAGYS